MSKLKPKVDHDRLAAYVEHMKAVYQSAIDAFGASESLKGSDFVRIRNHLECLAMVQELLKQHDQMANGRDGDYGAIDFGLRTLATLIRPDGTEIPIHRRPRNG